MAEDSNLRIKFSREERALFERYIPKERLDRIEAGDVEPRLGPPRTIGLLLCQVRDDDAETMARLVAEATSLLTKSGATVEIIHSSLIVATFGAMDFAAEPAALEPTITRLRDRLGGDIKLLHGVTTVRVGSIGGAHRLAFGSVVPHFGDWLAALIVLEYGENQEMPRPPLAPQHPTGQPGL